MIPKISYFDIFLGHPGQSPSAFLHVPLKMAALNFADALERAVALGFDRAEIMQLEKFSVRAKSGNTVLQFTAEDHRSTDAYLTGSLGVLQERREREKVERSVKLKPRKYRESAVKRMPD